MQRLLYVVSIDLQQRISKKGGKYTDRVNTLLLDVLKDAIEIVYMSKKDAEDEDDDDNADDDDNNDNKDGIDPGKEHLHPIEII